jgi:hypothetical protein
MSVEPPLIGEDGAGQERDPDGCDRDLDHGTRRYVFGPALLTQWPHGQIQRF